MVLLDDGAADRLPLGVEDFYLAPEDFVGFGAQAEGKQGQAEPGNGDGISHKTIEFLTIRLLDLANFGVQVIEGEAFGDDAVGLVGED